MTLPYETIFSRTRGRISDPKELSLDENDLLEIYTERLSNVISNPRVRRLFSWSFPEPWNKRVGIKHGWEQAEKASISPLQDFKRRIDQYQKTEYQKDYENIWNKYKSNIKIDI